MIGKKMSLVKARGLLMNTLFKSASAVTATSSPRRLTGGDLVELPARCAKERSVGD